MKRIALIFALMLMLLPSAAHAVAVGTCAQAFSEVYSATGPTALGVLTFTCTASVDDASFPSTATTQTITDQIAGRYIVEVRTNPGSTAPQAAYDIVINDADGIDLMGGTLADRSATLSQAAAPVIVTNVPQRRPIDGALTLAITNNNVNSAGVVVKVFLTR